ncbi:MAG: MOSC domain-containing protein [Robiginitomaculum sp.]|nr:MAG: MOSC domain-containing protein [Robiginitomaculum sp.]
MLVKSLHIYPVKSCHGIDLAQADVRERGLAGDRRFMLVDGDGQFITQRQNPNLARVNVCKTNTGLLLTLDNHPPLNIDMMATKIRKNVTVWRSTLEVCWANADVNEILSTWFGKTVSLVFMDEKSQRMVNSVWASTPSQVSFADGYPILVTNTASLDALNAHIVASGGDPVPMSRFRPNVVVHSEEAWGEDNWKSLQIGDVVLDLVKPCTRCIMTTLDQNTGKKQSREPLRALKTLRTSPDPNNAGVIFGMNAVVRKTGDVQINTPVQLVL